MEYAVGGTPYEVMYGHPIQVVSEGLHLSKEFNITNHRRTAVANMWK
uniref:Uncharacterized protein n=1 Tax=Lepeophtheirus salmonis TaxID=72036 RepID=A0A0K2U844_LEPSM